MRAIRYCIRSEYLIRAHFALLDGLPVMVRSSPVGEWGWLTQLIVADAIVVADPIRITDDSGRPIQSVLSDDCGGAIRFLVLND